MPRTIQRWKMRYATMIGMETSVTPAMIAPYCALERLREHPAVLPRQVDGVDEEAVPERDERKQAQREVGRPRQRHDDAEEAPPRPGAVDGRRILKLARQSEEVLPEEERGEWGAEEHRNDDRQGRVQPAEFTEDHVLRDERHMDPVSYTHLRAHETDSYLVCRLLLEKKKKEQ